ncbi:protein-tyrosine phosphatase-like protein, partial [Piptocephalis cylindrospora]
WFYEQGFDDTFPSRILPFMYLGDLRQASDVRMLRDLGITNLLSVGITVPVPHRDIGVKVIEHLDDDGLHLISPSIPHCLEYIDRVHAQGGRVLVHCQVGTSRSASICIAYMMERVGMDLMDAYMWVRARRIAVIIQPNLMFMWELWEREL